MTFEELKPKVIDILHRDNALRDEKLLQLCHLLKDNKIIMTGWAFILPMTISPNSY